MKKNDIEELLFFGNGFFSCFKEVVSLNKLYLEGMTNADKATQDILHNIELNTLSSLEKTKSVTLLSKIRKDRRYYKDKVEALEAIIENFNTLKTTSPGFEKSLNKLANCFGIVSKKYKNREKRKYTPRIIKNENLEKEKEKV
jgi:hypothetical protein